MIYKSYDEAVSEVIRSKMDYDVLVLIRQKFTHKQTEVFLSPIDIIKSIGTSRQNVTSIINRMMKSDLLKRVSRGTYRLNPYMYIPYQALGAELQKEWDLYSAGSVK